MRELLQARATAVVCAAACGVDLIALTEAESLGLRRRIVLPFDVARFRKTSVIDRPGEWGEPYDRVIAAAEKSGDLLVASGEVAASEDELYLLANRIILDEAVALAHDGSSAAALLVWDGKSRGPGDITAQFADSARERGLQVLELRIV